MGGGDSRPRESRSNEYEPREPDDDQGGLVGSTGGEGDTIQTELSGYVREGNPSDEGPVPEFGEGEDPFAQLGEPSEREQRESGDGTVGEGLTDVESEGDSGYEGGEQSEGGESLRVIGSEPSQERVRRMAGLTAIWSGTKTTETVKRKMDERADQLVDEVVERTEEASTGDDGDTRTQSR